MELSQNKLKYLVSLHQKKFRDKDHVFIAEGLKVVNDLVKFGMIPSVIVYDPQRWQLEDFGQKHAFCDYYTITNQQAKKLSLLSTPPGVFAVFPQPSFDFKMDWEQPLFVLDKISDPGNLGTIIRTAHWFGVKHLFITSGSVELYNPKVVQASMGSLAAVDVHIIDNEDFANILAEKDCPVYIAGMQGKSLKNSEINTPMCIVMGSESHGVSDYWKSQATEELTITSAQSDDLPDSLNISTSTAIIMNHFMGV